MIKKSNLKAFTLIELLTVIGIIGILSAIAVPSYAVMKKNASLNSYTQELANTLRVAKNQAVTSQDGTDFGVRLAPNSYTLCKDNCAHDIYNYNLDNGISIINSSDTVYSFKRLTGNLNDASTPGDIVIGFSGGQQKVIEIDALGKVTIK